MKISRIAKKVQDVTADVMSAPIRYKVAKKMKKDDELYKDILLERETKHLDIGDADYTNPIFRARANVSNFKTKLEQNKNKKKRYNA